SALTESQTQFVVGKYRHWLPAERRAAQLDPGYGLGWMNYAEAAMFQGDERTALSAYAKAAAILKDDPRVFSTGINMHLPQWLDDAEEQHRIARAAAEATYENPEVASALVD